ncbi:putative dehydrogenase/reductase [Nocardia wallacei]|uniref:Putative dehydrogenase/reductase n=2 Tax=Nocardia wallacei TaxID=480035 RepID=A0A7G1KFS2_9NOCA|nr:putative dehydrogenase/reductase [Nocardia wallacei]
MTGGTSGFGAIAADRIACTDSARLLLGARRTATGAVLPLDLTELASVRAFATEVRETLGDTRIDALVLNAGVIRPDADGRTVDGFETTFAVNHLAHYLLLRLLLPLLTDTATVVLTTSGTHDPATKGGLTPPRHADATLLAHPDRDPGRDPTPRKAGQHAYTAAKLCAVLTARALSEYGGTHRRLTAIAYCPGQVFGTGLAGNLAFPLPVVWSLLGTPALARPLRAFNRHFNTPAAAGAALADLALGHATPPDGRTYAALRRGVLTWPQPSESARDPQAARALWADSAELVGMSP